MALRVFYEAGLQATSEDITDRVRLYTPDVKQNAEEGSVAMSSLVIDDPLGDYDIKGWRRIRIYEDAATGSNTLIYNGWVADRKVERGPYLVGAGRQWNVSLADMNTVLGLRVLHNPDANRPAETDIARLNWLLGTLGSPGIPVTEYLNTTGPIAMDAVDYRGQTRFDVVNDCSQASGKNFFVYTKDAAMMGGSLQLGLWYDFAGSTEYASVIRLSNVVSDLDEWTFAIGDDTYLVRDPSRSYSGVYLQYDGGSVYEESITTSNEFTRRDAVVPAANVKTSAKATARALRYLGEMNREDDRITTSYYCPAPKVNFLREGMSVQFKARHLPGYAAFNVMRVMTRTVKEVTELEEDPEPKYLVTVELSQNYPPQFVLEDDPPDAILMACNDLSIPNREADDSIADLFETGQTWYYEASNTAHEDNAWTEEFRLRDQVDFVAVAGGNADGVLQGTPLSGVYPAPFPTQTGTWVVTNGGPAIMDCSTDGYVVGGPTFIDDCWEVKLWRLS